MFLEKIVLNNNFRQFNGRQEIILSSDVAKSVTMTPIQAKKRKTK